MHNNYEKRMCVCVCVHLYESQILEENLSHFGAGSGLFFGVAFFILCMHF